jgi:cohesin loading factor subunit SCC2
MEAVTNRLSDPAKSVRESAIKLVGKYVTQLPGLIADFHVAICDKMLDVGVSVRKRALKIISEVLLNNPDHPLRTDICIRLIDNVSRLTDRDEDRGEDERDLAIGLFQRMWFAALPEESDDGGSAQNALADNMDVDGGGEN